MWRWRGQLDPDERLQHLVAMRMGTLDDAEQAALELVAVGRPLTADCLQQLGVSELVAELERRGLVASQHQGRPAVTLAHPLFGEVLRDRMPSTRLDEVHLDLADAVEATCDGSQADQLSASRCGASKPATVPDPSRCARRPAGATALGADRRRAARARRARGRPRDRGRVRARSRGLSDQNRAEDALDAFGKRGSLRGTGSPAGGDRHRRGRRVEPPIGAAGGCGTGAERNARTGARPRCSCRSRRWARRDRRQQWPGDARRGRRGRDRGADGSHSRP